MMMKKIADSANSNNKTFSGNDNNKKKKIC